MSTSPCAFLATTPYIYSSSRGSSTEAFHRPNNSPPAANKKLALLVGGGLLSALLNALVLPMRRVNTTGYSIRELSQNIILSPVVDDHPSPSFLFVPFILKQTFGFKWTI
jgi:hypothetical protein